MKFFIVIQLALLPCICENIDENIIKLDSIIFNTITDPKPHLWGSLRENISDLYMNLDDVYEKIKQDDEEGCRIVDTIESKGGLHLSNLNLNNTNLAESFNITEDKFEEIQQAVCGTQYIWNRIARTLNCSRTTHSV